MHSPLQGSLPMQQDRRCNKTDISDVVKHVKHRLILPEPHHQATGLAPNLNFE